MKTQKQTLNKTSSVRRLLALLAGGHPLVLAVSAPQGEQQRERPK